jgi:hypothetical protein
MQKNYISLILDSSISELLEQRILTSGDLAKVLSFMHPLVGCDPVCHLANLSSAVITGSEANFLPKLLRYI